MASSALMYDSITSVILSRAPGLIGTTVMRAAGLEDDDAAAADDVAMAMGTPFASKRAWIAAGE